MRRVNVKGYITTNPLQLLDFESACWNSHGTCIASGSVHKTLRICNTENRTCKIILNALDEEIESVSWSPDGDYIATSSPDGKIRIFKTKSGIRVSSFPG